MASNSLPEVDSEILRKACEVAEALEREPNPTTAALLRETALTLWTDAHAARRAAMYGRRARS